MLQSKVISKQKNKTLNRNVTNVILKSQVESIDLPETDAPQTLTKTMFLGLAITSVVLFYLAFSSLIL